MTTEQQPHNWYIMNFGKTKMTGGTELIPRFHLGTPKVEQVQNTKIGKLFYVLFSYFLGVVIKVMVVDIKWFYKLMTFKILSFTSPKY